MLRVSYRRSCAHSAGGIPGARALRVCCRADFSAQWSEGNLASGRFSTMTIRHRTLACSLALAIAVLFAPAVHAAELLNFKPVPVSPGLDDFTWTGTNFAS